jgi:hypothetical protein
MYLATSTRYDIAYTVGVLARFNSNPGLQHWKAVKHLLQYLKGTLDFRLEFGPDPSSSELFTTFSDADFGGNKDTGQSTGGYMVHFGSGAISWQSKLQPFVVLSTTEAEYISAVEAGKEIMWMCNILSELGEPVTGPSTLCIDNQSAIAVGKNPEHHGRMKHLNLQHFWLRNAVEDGRILLKYVSTNDMLADILTKALPRVRVVACCDMMGLQ